MDSTQTNGQLAREFPPPPKWLADMVRSTPQLPLMAPFMSYLLLLLLDDLFPAHLRHVGMVIRCGLTLWIVWVFRRWYPPWGGLNLGISIVVGVLAAWLWVAGQHLLDRWGFGGTLSFGGLLSDTPKLLKEAAPAIDPHDNMGPSWNFWAHVVIKIGVATTAVPIVEELFWRGLLLRAFVSWDRFDEVPWGRFTWFAFLGTSLLSVMEHPANWGVSIACWFLYNGLFYWKKSLLCLMATHAVTNLVLYAYVVGWGDWRFW